MHKGILICILTLLEHCAQSALTANAIIHADGAARGALTQAKLNSSIFGATGGWIDQSPYTFWTIVAGSNQYSFPRPVTVSGTAYVTNEFRWSATARAGIISVGAKGF